MAASSRISTGRSARRRFPVEWEPWIGSLLSWVSLGAAACLAALIVLAPRLLENRQLERRLLENTAELRLIEGQMRQLKAVSQALQTDPDFIARVAAAERLQFPGQETRIPVGKDLGFDVSQPHDIPAVLPERVDSRATKILQRFAEPGWFRLACLIGTGILFLFSFGSNPNGFLIGSRERMVGAIQERYGNL